MTLQTLSLLDHHPSLDGFAHEVRRGLGLARKQLPCKFLYDARGSHLFDRICQLPEYYLTRTELSIMRRGGEEMARLIGHDALLVEFGSGSSLKTRLLLDHLPRCAGYVPIDISREHLMRSAGRLAAAYPHVEILPVCADYTAEFTLPVPARHPRRTVVYFPGSTIGNFHPHEARAFLRRIRDLAGEGGALLIGVDLKKDPAILHAAYNDAAGVTAQFNLNLLRRINHELGGDFDLDRFIHHAPYNPRRGRIEMHLISMADRTVHIRRDSFRFREGESIFTECSYKYTLNEFATLSAAAGFGVNRVWLDDQRLFSVQYLCIS